jgi:NADPH-dependent curcumin reductase CurA
MSARERMNQQFRLAARPAGMPKRSDFEFREEPVREPAEGELLIELQYISLDPAMRGWMNAGRSYVAPVEIGAVMRAGGAGEVMESRSPNFAPGDFVVGMFGVQRYATVDARMARKVDTKPAPLPVYMSALGMTGLTAYFGLLDVGQPKAGETVVVSAAAGAVGMVAGQIAKIKGCRVVGIAGGAEKCRWITRDLGFDAAIDYKNEKVRDGLAKYCPDGVNVYFDNVGGEILDEALARLARGARIVICGAISQYNSAEGIKGPANYLSLLVNRARMQGMLVFDYEARYGEAIGEMASWMREGKLKSREQIEEGFERFPEVLLMLFKGENTGKLLLKV